MILVQEISGFVFIQKGQWTMAWPHVDEYLTILDFHGNTRYVAKISLIWRFKEIK